MQSLLFYLVTYVHTVPEPNFPRISISQPATFFHTVAGRVNLFPSACCRHPCPLVGKVHIQNKATNSWVPETVQHNRNRPIQSTPQSQVPPRLSDLLLTFHLRDQKKGEKAYVSSLMAATILQGVVLDVMAFPGAVDSLGVFCTTTCVLSLQYLSFY